MLHAHTGFAVSCRSPLWCAPREARPRWRPAEPRPCISSYRNHCRCRGRQRRPEGRGDARPHGPAIPTYRCHQGRRPEVLVRQHLGGSSHCAPVSGVVTCRGPGQVLHAQPGYPATPANRARLGPTWTCWAPVLGARCGRCRPRVLDAVRCRRGYSLTNEVAGVPADRPHRNGPGSLDSGHLDDAVRAVHPGFVHQVLGPAAGVRRACSTSVMIIWLPPSRCPNSSQLNSSRATSSLTGRGTRGARGTPRLAARSGNGDPSSSAPGPPTARLSGRCRARPAGR